MAVYRNVRISFWSDPKVRDEFTPEDKFFYMYLLTNPNTNLCGCYEVSYRGMTEDTGYNKDTVIRLIERFEKQHKVIEFDKETKEILILNWYRYNWSRSDKTVSGVRSVAERIKSKHFREYVLKTLDKFCGKQTDDSLYVEEIKEEDSFKDEISCIVDYLNQKCGTRYRCSTPNTKKHIKARIKDGYSVKDFYTVIDKKADDWIGTENEKYLRPDTLFGPKFESYLNQMQHKKKSTERFDEWRDA